MEGLLQEQSEAAKIFSKNVIFNQAYDQTKVMAENLSKYNTERFLELMEAVNPRKTGGGRIPPTLHKILFFYMKTFF